MKKLTSMWLAIVCLIQVSGGACAQAQEKLAPGFTLTITQVGYGGTTPGNYAVLVREKNISGEEIRGGGCLALRDWFNVSVAYNGIPMKETDAVKRLQKVRKLDKPCEGSYTGWKIDPGKEYLYQLNVTEFYDMSKPGKYEITVTKESNPEDPQLSTTVKSNTITIVVP